MEEHVSALRPKGIEFPQAELLRAYAVQLHLKQIARQLGHGRDTVKKALIEATPRPYTRSKPVSYPKLGAFVSVIEQILKEDDSAPRKQRHTARRIFARLVEEHGYGGKYDQVRRYVRKHRRAERETAVQRRRRIKYRHQQVVTQPRID